MLKIIRERDTGLLLQRAALHVCQKLQETFASRSIVNIAVPGGRSVAGIFEAMSAEQLDWKRVHFFTVDERLVPVDHPDSNFKILNEHFIIPMTRSGRFLSENAHSFTVNNDSADRGARAYEETLAKQGFRYDIILLNSGDDGHVGALFPGHHSVADEHHGFIVMDDAPIPPPERMTSSLSLMLTADIGVLLVVGESRRRAFARFEDASIPASGCPAKLVVGMKDAAVFTDQG